MVAAPWRVATKLLRLLTRAPDEPAAHSLIPARGVRSSGMSPLIVPNGEAVSQTPRFMFIDGLRGLASLGVALSHLVWLLPYPLPLFEYGMHGLEVFFVISGFVIAHTLRRTDVTVAFCARFFVRRSVRLDPAYWVAIVGQLFVVWLWAEPLPSLSVIGLNAAYLHELAQVPYVLEISWTLCLEFQFYLVYVAALGLSQWIARRLSGSEGAARLAVFGVLALLSVFSGIAWGIHPWLETLGNVPGLFVSLWYMFFLGVAVQWTLTEKLGRGWFLGFVFVLGVVLWIWRGPALVPRHEISPAIALASALVVYVAGVRRWLATGLGQGWLQYFGRISYSLYLVHAIVGVNVVYLGEVMHGTGPLATLGWFLAAFAASILAAHLLYVAVEKPSLAFNGRLKAQWAAGAPPSPDLRPSGERVAQVPGYSENKTTLPSESVDTSCV